ncbi:MULTISPECIES: alpha/beta hydrolase [unclassified Rhodococcus (in: high G+C Gram-positive bacteria)]|uniref:alpha/beta hydrolase n=1 Tax=unclassified Rhodococcus (in: high G+C Gram-positive bacteria) TaxID=192944 RepID=UPI001BB4176C|nr:MULTISPECIES: alpha/beta hydrolase [unclassified Rhodococcus (in: high G+C Gram-positive bacteria)]
MTESKKTGSNRHVETYDPGYDGEIRSVRVPALAWEIAANLLLPSGFDENKKYPAVVCGHPIGSCKEQTAGNIYGAALAKEGYVAIAFDASFQGESGGQPRFIEDPTQRSADFSHVVDYLVTQDFIDADRIAVLGVCGSGGYCINSAMTERRFKAIVSVTGVNFGRLMNEEFSQFDPVAALEQMAAQRTAEARGGEAKVNNYLPDSPDDAEKSGATEVDLYEATLYYRTPRGEQPNGCTRALFSYQSKAVGWDAFHRAEKLLTQPLLVAIGDIPGAFGAYRDGREIYSRAASKDKELVEIAGGTHYDLYDKKEAVTQILDRAIPFLAKHV